MLSGEALAAAVLEAKDRYALLSLGRREGGDPIRVGSDGYLNHEDEEVRKCYTRIAARIHPDKLRCAEATKAFQALVRAYELCCKPDVRADDSDDSREEEEEAAEAEEEEAEAEEPQEQQEQEQEQDSDASPAGNPPKPKPKPPTPKPPKHKPSRPKAKAKSKEATGGKGGAEAQRTGVKCPRCRADWGEQPRTGHAHAHAQAHVQ